MRARMQTATNPSLPYTFLTTISGPTTGGIAVLQQPQAFFTPPMIMLILICYLGYHILSRQASSAATPPPGGGGRGSSGKDKDKDAAAAKREQKPLTAADIDAKGFPYSNASRVGDPEPTKASSSSSEEGGRGKGDPSSVRFTQNYFMTMLGPGRPALVPFQAGLRPKPGEPAGTMWWGNVPKGECGHCPVVASLLVVFAALCSMPCVALRMRRGGGGERMRISGRADAHPSFADATDLMAPPVDPSRPPYRPKNPWAAEIFSKDIQLLKLQKTKIEEDECVISRLLTRLLCVRTRLLTPR
jgi:hypothetical protein